MEKALRYTRVVLVLLSIVVCVLLCWQAIDIYQTGNAPENFSSPGVHINSVWSREIVGARLLTLSPVLLLWLVAVAVSIVLKINVPEKEKITPPARDMLELMKRRINPLPAEAAAMEKTRRTVWIAAIAVSAACAIPCGIYLAQKAHFENRDLEVTMSAMLLALLPWLFIAFACLLAASIYESRSIQKEIDLLKMAPKSVPAPAPAETKSVFPVQCTLLAVSILLIVLGIFNGGAWDVLVKAVNICTECIGLG